MLNHSDVLKPAEAQEKLIAEATATLDWMDEVVGAALKEARENRDTTMLNRLGKSNAFSFYINNVFGTRTVPREQFARQYPGLMTEARQLYADYQEKIELKEAVVKTNAIEEQLKELKTLVEAQAIQIAAMREAQTVKPVDKKGKKPVEVEPVEPEDAE